jgi:homoserine O-succinyltransferase
VTIILPKFYHIRRALEESRVVCISAEQAAHQDIRPLRIGILNVMPMAETYEYTILQPLGRSILQIEPIWIRLKSHAYKTSNWEHIRSAYVTFEEAMQNQPLDGLLLTGAPVEELAFEEVHYWEELAPILSQARQHCASTLGLCWGGLALAKLIGVEKTVLNRKLFGVFSTRNI